MTGCCRCSCAPYRLREARHEVGQNDQPCRAFSAFGLAVAALSSAGQPTLAALLGIAVIINYAIMVERVIWLLKH